jgi:hypothetical protein
VVDSGVGDDDEPWFLEGTRDVVGEGTWSEATGNGLGSGVGSVFEDSAVSVRARRDHTDIIRVFDGGNDAGGKDELFPGFANVENVDS